MVWNALIQDSKLHTVIQYLIPDSPLVQISPHPVKAVIGQGQGKGLLPRRCFCSGNIHRSLLTQDFYGFRISHAIYLHQKPKGRHSTDIPGFPMPFTGDLINLKTIMVLKLPFISCPCFLQSPRLVCLQILIGSHLLGCLILCFGVSPNTSGIASSRQSSAHTFPVPNVSTCTMTGWATPMA